MDGTFTIAIDDSPQPFAAVASIGKRLATDLIEPALQVRDLLSSSVWRVLEPGTVELKTREADGAAGIFVGPVKT